MKDPLTITGDADTINMNYLVSSIDESMFFDYKVLNDYGFSCVDYKTVDKYTYEVYQNRYNETIAIVRALDKVYCMQYINDADYNESLVSGNGILDYYGHESSFEGSGMYYHAVVYFFRDGSAIIRVKDSPNEDFSYIGFTTYSESIMNYLTD